MDEVTAAGSGLGRLVPFAVFVSAVAIVVWRLILRRQASGRDGLALLIAHLDPAWNPVDDPRPIFFRLTGSDDNDRPRLLLQITADDERWTIADRTRPRELVRPGEGNASARTLIRLRIRNPHRIRLLIQSGPFVTRAPPRMHTLVPHASIIAHGFRIHTTHPGTVQRMLEDTLGRHIADFAAAARGEGDSPLADAFRVHIGRFNVPPGLIRHAGGCFSVDGPRATYIEIGAISQPMGWRFCAAAEVLRDLARAIDKTPT